MKFMDICTRKTYKKGEEEKVLWLKCGTLRINDEGKIFIELNHLPNVTFYAFEQKKKEEGL